MTGQNREQRRREKFGRTGLPAKDQWPQSSPNPIFGDPDDRRAGGSGTGAVTQTHRNDPDPEPDERQARTA